MNSNGKIITQLWELACTGETENLILELENYHHGVINWRYEEFGKSHSLIIGAFRNGKFDTVKMLISEGGTIEPHEAEEITPYINTQRINVMEKLIDELLLPESERNQDNITQLRKRLINYSNLINLTEN